MFFGGENKDFIKECLIILVTFWLISFLVIFYRYQEAVTKEKDFQIELMMSQSELLSKTIAGEIKTALSDLIWYASDKKIRNGNISDVSSLNDEVLSQLLQYKDRYKRLLIYDKNNKLLKEVRDDSQLLLLEEVEDCFVNQDEINEFIFASTDRIAVIKIAPNGDIILALRTSDQSKIICLEFELENYNTLKLNIERKFGLFVGLSFEEGELWTSMGDLSIVPCGSGVIKTSYINAPTRLVTWSCLSSHTNLPYGIEDMIWLNDTNQAENSLVVMTTLSGAGYKNIEQNQLEQMKQTVIIVLFVQFVASIILGIVYHKYQQSQEALKMQATRDVLTGCMNRWAGLEILKKLMAMSDRESSDLTVAFIDIDNLKTVNDNYGHDDGDLFIQIVADSINSYVRDADSLVRIGGDEFLLILPNCKKIKADDILHRSSALLDSFNASKRYSWQASFSYGLSSYKPNANILAHDLIQMADQAMYVQKHKKNKLKER